MRTRHRIAEAFQAGALRCTPQRYAVMEYLMRSPVHATADEIFRAINRTDPRASRATVYNSLHALVRAGFVRQVAIEGSAVRFDANIDRHHHFVCDGCGAVEDIPWFDLKVEPPLGARSVRTYEVVFRGTCGQCSSARSHR